ncbi:MAG: 1-(5-phosphoribosyl)-5-[(5-phosphoribosylamino)methylideneamino]imidazole-4-carboxamide isomerase [Acidimicrobiales bacterium]|nr:1-(5-phosphoribosyl)-5-[(5-phosphoribosylamino)methylideneamino]imidazole-4-carboxamide isomerase [Acidimicrobiales bacterium]
MSVLELYPAIDLRDGRCVRLYQGDYDRETVYGEDPVAQAAAFVAEGARWLHVVDLDAARSGSPVNRDVVAAVARSVDIPVQTGGGVRSLAAAGALVDAGVTRVVVGTAAVERPELVSELVGEGIRVAVGLDVRGRDVAVHGWEQASGTDVREAVRRFEDVGADAVIVTQISQDGTLAGPDLDGLGELLGLTTLPLIASGGVGDLEHVRSLAALDVGGRRLAGAIVGRALYEGTLALADAVRVTHEVAGERG